MTAVHPPFVLFLEEVLDSFDKDMQLLLDSDDDRDVDIIAAICTFMRHKGWTIRYPGRGVEKFPLQEFFFLVGSFVRFFFHSISCARIFF